MSVDERLESFEAELVALRRDYTEVTSLLEQLVTTGAAGDNTVMNEAEPLDSAGEASVSYASWADEADDEAWNALMDWADWLMSTYYETAEPYLQPCWPQHPGLVEDLAGLKMAWEHAVAACAEAEWAGSEALEYFHDRYLPGFMHRARNLHGMQSCASRHETSHRRIARTDRSGAVVAATGRTVA